MEIIKCYADKQDLLAEAYKRGLVELWHKCANGKEIKVSEMSDIHIINTIKFLERQELFEEAMEAID